MDDLHQVKDQVESVLKEYPASRDSDKLLQVIILQLKQISLTLKAYGAVGRSYKQRANTKAAKEFEMQGVTCRQYMKNWQYPGSDIYGSV